MVLRTEETHLHDFPPITKMLLRGTTIFDPSEASMKKREGLSVLCEPGANTTWYSRFLAALATQGCAAASPCRRAPSLGQGQAGICG